MARQETSSNVLPQGNIPKMFLCKLLWQRRICCHVENFPKEIYYQATSIVETQKTDRSLEKTELEALARTHWPHLKDNSRQALFL